MKGLLHTRRGAYRFSRRDAFGLGLGGLSLAFGPSAEGAGRGSLFRAVADRSDLRGRARRAWVRALQIRFSRVAREPETSRRPEIATAKAILSIAIFRRLKPETGVSAAWEGWAAVRGHVPPPIAVYYQVLAFEGRKPRGPPLELARDFPDHYSKAVAPDLVAWWVAALDAGSLPDRDLEPTRAALAETRIKMRPLLLDKLRLLARLDRARRVAEGVRRAELGRDLEAVEAELARSFERVCRRPEVLDRSQRPFERLMLALDDLGQTPSQDERYLDPDGPNPPKRPIPVVETQAAEVTSAPTLPLVEPAAPPPLAYLPAQPRPGDPEPFHDPVPRRSLSELVRDYATRLNRTLQPWMGTPYRSGHSSVGLGTDGAGLVRRVFERGFLIPLPSTSPDQFRMGRSVPQTSLRPGDLLFFDTSAQGGVDHVAIFVGDDSLAHANATQGVIVEPLSDRFRFAFRGARRLLAFPG